MSLLANAGRLLILRIGGQLGMLGAIIYFTRILSPGSLGEYFYFESLLGVVSIFAAFGIGGAVEKFVSEGDEQAEWFTTGILVMACFSVTAMLAFILLTRIYNNILQMSYLPLFLIALFGRQYMGYFRHMLQAELRAAKGGVLQFIHVFVFIISSIILVNIGWDPLGLIVAAVLARILVLPIAKSMLNTPFSKPSWEKATDIVHFAKYYFITVIGSKVYQYADVVLVGLLLTKADVGRYEVAWRLILGGIVLNGVIGGTVFSYISRDNAEDNTDLVSDNIKKALKYVLILPFGCAAGAAVIGTDLITKLFTTEYVADNTIIIILSVGFIFQSFYSLFSRSLVAMDKARESFYATIVGISSNISLNLVLIPIYGLQGAAVATTLSFFVAAISYYYLLRRHVKIEFPIRRIITQFCAATLMLFVLFVARSYTSEPSSVITLGLFLLGGGTYLIGLLIFETTRSDLRVLLDETSL